MASNSGIEWTDHTFNPWIGCTKVSPACDNCYAERQDHRFGGGHWGPGAPRKRTKPGNWNEPRKWNRQAEREGTRYRVFCASLADVFDNEVPAEWRADLWELIRETPNLDWLLLTKRIGNAEAMLPEDWGNGWGNVCIGATVVTQEEADRDIPKLLDVPAAVRFVSAEPLLEAIDLSRYMVADYPGGPYMTRCEYCGWIGNSWLCHTNPPECDDVVCPSCLHSIRGDDAPGLDWVIAGGESGPQARPMHPDWVRSLRDQCREAEVPFFFKQWGEWAPETQVPGAISERTADTALYVDLEGGSRPAAQGARCRAATVQKVGKKAAGRQLDGETWDQVPTRELADA